MDLSLLKIRANSIGTDRIGDRMSREIRIISSIQFTCSTTITNVILGIHVVSRPDDDNIFPSLQLWRPDGEDHTLITERLIVYTPANVSRTGVYEYPLVPSIDVLAGDLIAISQPGSTTSKVRCYYIDDFAFNSYSVDCQSTIVSLSNSNLIDDELILAYPVTGENYIMQSLTLTFNYYCQRYFILVYSLFYSSTKLC